MCRPKAIPGATPTRAGYSPGIGPVSCLDRNSRTPGDPRRLCLRPLGGGVNFFQAPDRDGEGTDTSGIVDLNGVKLFDGILAAALGGGGFTEYLCDNPAMKGDEETG